MNHTGGQASGGVHGSQRRQSQTPTTGDDSGVAFRVIKDIERPIAVWICSFEKCQDIRPGGGGKVRERKHRRIIRRQISSRNQLAGRQGLRGRIAEAQGQIGHAVGPAGVAHEKQFLSRGAGQQHVDIMRKSMGEAVERDSDVADQTGCRLAGWSVPTPGRRKDTDSRAVLWDDDGASAGIICGQRNQE